MKTKIALIASILILSLVHTSFACTEFTVKAKDGSVVIGRSMELAIDTQSRIWFYPKGESHTSVIPKKGNGISWTSKYAFLGIDAFGEKELLVDGINEKGLAMEALFFSGVKYQEYVADKSIALNDLGVWLLGSFATVDEVKQALQDINIIGVYVKKLHAVQGLHLAAHDAQGNSIVIEFDENGNRTISDNPLGVMTNRPSIDWQLNNLRNYINLDNYDNKPKKLGAIEIESTGSGNGWHGIPGDWTPPSRFVRVALFANKAPQPKNVSEAITLANHVLYTVDIPHGLIVIKEPLWQTVSEQTQWVVMKDLANQKLYYRSYNDGALRVIDLNKLVQTSGKGFSPIPIENEATIMDVTAKLMN